MSEQAAEWQCPSCGRLFSSGSFCTTCGARLQARWPETGQCPACGAANLPEDTYCRTCGQPLTAPVAGPATAAPATPPSRASRPGLVALVAVVAALWGLGSLVGLLVLAAVLFWQPEGGSQLAGLSPMQEEIVAEFGWPQSFLVLELEDGEGRRARQETWNYFDGETAYVFLDGELATFRAIDPLPDGSDTTPYQPNQFVLGSAFGEVEGLLAEGEWTQLPGLEKLAEGVEICAGKQLILGFHDQRLVFVRSLALAPEVTSS